MNAPATNAVTELEMLFPDDGKIVINGEEIVVKPLKLKQLKGVLKLVEAFQKNQPDAMPIVGDNGSITMPEAAKTNWLQLINTNSDLVTEALGLAIGKDAAFMDELQFDDVLKVAVVVVKVNADFFTTHALPALMKVMDGLPAMIAQATSGGPKQS